MEKFVRDGRVAVVFSNCYGVPFASIVGELCMHKDIVQAVLDNDLGRVQTILDAIAPDEYYFFNGDLRVAWVPEGAQFRVHEYAGCETVVLKEMDKYFTA